MDDALNILQLRQISTREAAQFVETHPQNATLKRLDSRCEHCNAKLAHYLGYASIKEVVGISDYDAPARAFAAHYVASDQRVINTGKPWSGIEMSVNKDDCLKVIYTQKIPVIDREKPEGVVVVFENRC